MTSMKEKVERVRTCQILHEKSLICKMENRWVQSFSKRPLSSLCSFIPKGNVMVQAATGPESPVEEAFHDLFEVIPELADLEMYNSESSAQIVPGREASPDTLFSKLQSFEDAKLYGSDTNLTMIKEEPMDSFTPCHFGPSSQLNGAVASRFLPALIMKSMMVDQERGEAGQDPFISPRQFDLESQEASMPWMYEPRVEQEATEHSAQMLILQAQQKLNQGSTVESRDFYCDHRNPAPSHGLCNEITREPELKWFNHHDDLMAMESSTEQSSLSSDPYFSEYSSDIDQAEIKPKQEQREEDEVSVQNEQIWFGTSNFSPFSCKREKLDIRKDGKKPKATFKTGRPRLCAFLLELLNKPEKYSHLIEWVDEEKGIFKFLNSTKVAREWGERRNKPMMKYENFARSLRTYIAKGILSKPRSKLVYRFKK